jgi:hypothetical protein
MKPTSIIGIDFSLMKPSCCIFYDKQFRFMSWPKGLDGDLISLYRDSGVEIINREDNDKEAKNMSIKARHEVESSHYICDLISNYLRRYVDETTLIAFEGSSFGSAGNVVIQLSSRRYFLMNKLWELTSINHMFTYAPITVKKVAGCSFKGSKKKDMIESFITDGPKCKLRDNLMKDKPSFMKKKSVNFKDHLDDLVDSYFVLKTLNEKEDLCLF